MWAQKHLFEPICKLNAEDKNDSNNEAGILHFNLTILAFVLPILHCWN